MTRRCTLFILFLFGTAPAWACFGPKLYIGVEPGVAGDLNFALVSLYIKEKTGVEGVRVDMADRDAVAAVAAAEQVDLATAPATNSGALLTLPDGTILLAGKRVRDDLQFTTVLPALNKLQRVLAQADGAALLARVRAGEGAVAVARSWFKAQKAL
jgi:hypothetical protein